MNFSKLSSKNCSQQLLSSVPHKRHPQLITVKAFEMNFVQSMNNIQTMQMHDSRYSPHLKYSV